MKIKMQTYSTPKQIFENIINDQYADRFEFKFDQSDDRVIYLYDESFDSCRATLTFHDWGLEIITAWSGYRYELSLSGLLTYEGPYMGFLEQQLLPDFDYTSSKLLQAEVETSLSNRYDLTLGQYAVEYREPFVQFKREQLNWKCDAHPFAVVLAMVEDNSYTTSWKAVGGGEVVCEIYADGKDGELYLGEFHGSNGTREEAWTQDWSTVSRSAVFDAFTTMMEAGVFHKPKQVYERTPGDGRRRDRRRRKI